MADTFGTQVWVNDVDFFALTDRIVRALRFTNIAVYAVLIDLECHKGLIVNKVWALVSPV